jgi:DNA-binding NarL/FixJ family response regulator
VKRVFVVDDTTWFRSAAEAVIAATEGFEFAGSAASAAEGARALENAVQPDLVLMDVDLGDGSGIELTARLTDVRPELRILLVSTLDRQDLPAGADTCGAIGFLSKIDLSPAMLRRHTGVA